MSRKPTPAQTSLRTFAGAMAQADKYRRILKDRYGFDEQQIREMARTAIRKQRERDEQEQLQSLDTLLKLARRMRGVGK
jgi:hypothetical protein